MAITIHRDKGRKSSIAMVAEFVNDLEVIQGMAGGVLIMYNVAQFVFRCYQNIRPKALPNTPSHFLKTVDPYRVSVNSLFIFEIFEETLRSIVRSPISTTKPPWISGFTLQSVSLCKEGKSSLYLTLGMTLSFLP